MPGCRAAGLRWSLLALTLAALACGGGSGDATQTPFVLVVTATDPPSMPTLLPRPATRTPASTPSPAPPTATPIAFPGFQNVELLPNDVLVRSVPASENVIQALAVFGIGGGGDEGPCQDPVQVFPDWVVLCGLPWDQPVVLALHKPDGTIFRTTLEVTSGRLPYDADRLHQCFDPSQIVEAGAYQLETITAAGTYWRSFTVQALPAPQVFLSLGEPKLDVCDGLILRGRPAQLFFAGFQPDETVRAVLYAGDGGDFQYLSEWPAQMDSRGRLVQLIEAPELPGERYFALIAYGQQQTALRWLSPADDFESVVVASAVVYFRGTLGYPDSIVPSTSVLVVPTPTPVVTVEPGRLADLARVPAGTFSMGSQPSDPFSESIERPQHAVQVSEFWIERTEVSNAAYAACVAAGGCTPPASASSSTRSAYYGSAAFDDYPVVNVTHGQAAAYCAWAGGRLPTEAEWEKAARGPETRYYPWGSERPNRTLANYGKIVNDTTAVDGYPAGASPYGLLNMGGNVWEWVADWYSATYYASSPPSDPPGPAAGQDRVVRGGSWGSDGQFLRTTNRFYHNPSNASPTVGFRCAATHEP